MKAVVAEEKEKALVITNLRMELFQALVVTGPPQHGAVVDLWVLQHVTLTKAFTLAQVWLGLHVSDLDTAARYLDI